MPLTLFAVAEEVVECLLLCRFSDALRLHNRQARLDLSVKVPATIVLVQLGQGFGIKLGEYRLASLCPGNRHGLEE